MLTFVQCRNLVEAYLNPQNADRDPRKQRNGSIHKKNDKNSASAKKRTHEACSVALSQATIPPSSNLVMLPRVLFLHMVPCQMIIGIKIIT